MNEKRVTQRRRVLRSAYIVISDKAPKIECAVRNFSEAGAALEVSTTFGIPNSFDIIIDGERRHCRSVWRTNIKMGVAFH